MAGQLQAFRQVLPEAAVVLARLDLLAQRIWVETAALDCSPASVAAPLITLEGAVDLLALAKVLAA